MRVKCLQLFFAFCISVPALSGATITSGSIEFSGPYYQRGIFTLSGDDFSISGVVHGLWDFGPPWYTPPTWGYDPGDSVRVSGYATGDSMRIDSATVDGITYSHLSWWNSWTHPGPTYLRVTGDPITLGVEPGVYTSTFSLEGALCGIIPGHGWPEPCLVVLPLSGIGIVAMTFVEGEGGSLLYAGATHTFIPEPSTLVLTTVGLALVIAAARRRKLRRYK